VRAPHPRRLAAAAVGCAVLAGAVGLATRGGTGTAAPGSFRLRDGSAGCTLQPRGAIACRRRGADSALVLEANGASSVRAAEVVWSDATPVLGAGGSRRDGGITCRAKRRAIVCSTTSGAQIVVGADGVGSLAPPAVYARSR
jgi:hypothetical protein